MSIIYFQGEAYDENAIPESLARYIRTYNRSQNDPETKTPEDTDFDFRMNQALQMFGDDLVVNEISKLIDYVESQSGGS